MSPPHMIAPTFYQTSRKIQLTGEFLWPPGIPDFQSQQMTTCWDSGTCVHIVRQMKIFLVWDLFQLLNKDEGKLFQKEKLELRRWNIFYLLWTTGFFLKWESSNAILRSEIEHGGCPFGGGLESTLWSEWFLFSKTVDQVQKCWRHKCAFSSKCKQNVQLQIKHDKIFKKKK